MTSANEYQTESDQYDEVKPREPRYRGGAGGGEETPSTDYTTLADDIWRDRNKPRTRTTS